MAFGIGRIFRGLTARRAAVTVFLGLGAAAHGGCARDVDGLTISNADTKTAAAQRLVRDLCGVNNPIPDQVSDAEKFLAKGPYDRSFQVTGAICRGLGEVDLSVIQSELTAAHARIKELEAAASAVEPPQPSTLLAPTICPPDHLRALLSAQPITVAASKDISISLTAPEGYLFVLNSSAQVLRNGESTADVWLERMMLDGTGRTLSGALRTKRSAFATGGSTYSIDAALKSISAEDTGIYRGTIDFTVTEPPARVNTGEGYETIEPPPPTPGGEDPGVI